MSFNSLVIVTDTDLARFEPEATHPDEPWGAATWDAQIEQAKRTLRIWIDADYGDLGPGASDRLRDRWAFTEAKTSIGGTWADVVTEAANDTEEDIDLAVTFATVGTDAIYVGAPFAFQGVFLHFLDSINATASVLTASYWAVDQWQTVPSPNDGTAVSGATFAQSGVVSWGPIEDWERRSLDGSDEGIYWVRLTVTVTPDAGTAVSHLLAVKKAEGLRSVAAMLALSYIFRGLALQSPENEVWTTSASEYMEEAKVLYDRMKTTGGLPLDVNVSGAVEPGEVGPGGTGASVVGRMPRA